MPHCKFTDCFMLALVISFFKPFKIYLFLAALGVSCGTWDLSLQCTDFSLVVAHGLSSPEACGILGPQAGLEPKSPALGANSGSVVKESTCNARDLGLIPGSGRSLGEGYGNPLQYCCLGNPMNRAARWAIVCGVLKIKRDLATKPPPPRLHWKADS